MASESGKTVATLLLTLLLAGSQGQARDAAIADPLTPLFAPTQGDTRAALLIVDGRVVAKRYATPYSDANRFISWSMAKSVTGMLVGALVAEGRLRLDDPAPVAEWRGDARRAITLRQLMQMSAGLRHVEVGATIENSDTNQAEFVTGTAAMAAYGIAQPLATAPGARFNYSTLTSIILSEIVTRTLTDSRDARVRAQAYTDFARTRLFAPAGVTSAVLEFDGAGTQVGGSLIHMTLDDWGRMGMLLLDGRGPGGAQVVAPDWLAFMKSPSPRDPQYGGQLWLNNAPLPGDTPVLFPGRGPADAVSMNGHLGQRVIAAKAGRHTVVLVRLGNTPDGDSRRVMDTIGDTIGAALIQAGETPPRSR